MGTIDFLQSAWTGPIYFFVFILLKPLGKLFLLWPSHGFEYKFDIESSQKGFEVLYDHYTVHLKGSEALRYKFASYLNDYEALCNMH